MFRWKKRPEGFRVIPDLESRGGRRRERKGAEKAGSEGKGNRQKPDESSAGKGKCPETSMHTKVRVVMLHQREMSRRRYRSGLEKT